ncbi:MAG: hypothetical protein E6X34_15555 [Clostridium sp.]|uniref:hypothetical protein n=1 Tax=Clostridium sp. TaxID=1506 RepID=UPI00290DCE6F|nr:hypothetical protein [Clostridium sp.]MDU4939853.1 hypothetical protein [Clostridium sp.]
MFQILKSNKDIQFYIEDFMEYCSLNGLFVKVMLSYKTTLNKNRAGISPHGLRNNLAKSCLM